MKSYKYTLLTLLLFLVASNLSAQTNLLELNPEVEFSHISINKIYSDESSTSFLIWIMDEVKPHKHETHTESLYVMEGTGDMLLGEKLMKIKKGDFILIPKNTVHSVKVTSNEALKVLSVQAPEFLGKDRVFID